MGRPGNITPYAEFNINIDLEAANVVFRSGLSVTMVGLNVTHQALVVARVARPARRSPGPASS